jgi:hypothetical protein
MINLFGNASQSDPIYCYNTDTQFDLITGDLVQGFDGKYYINGGLSSAVIGVLARPNMFKSTFSASLMARIAAIYQQQVAIFDSENSVNRGSDRLLRMAGVHQPRVTSEQFIKFNALTEYDLDSTLAALRDLVAQKKARAKDLMFTTPFIDFRTGKRFQTMAPTLVLIDSLSEMHSSAEEELINGKQDKEGNYKGGEGIDGSKGNTVYMLDANKKTIFLRNVLRLASEGNLIIVCTAHYGDKLNLNSYGPSEKLTQWMKQDRAPKGVGSKFMFYTSPQILMESSKCLLDDAKECWYKLNGSTPKTDINEVIALVQRCKNAASGTTFPYIVSQESGLLSDVTDYNYLKQQKFGMLGNMVTQQCIFNPTVNLTRNTIRGVCQKDPKEVRALQLASQLCYLQTAWSNDAVWNTFGFNIKVKPEELMDFLKSDKNKYTVDRLLSSRGYWIPEELEKNGDYPEYLSIFDVLEAYEQSKK